MKIGTYDGDGTDAAELMHRVWTKTYQGKIWFPLWAPEFLRWQFGGDDRRLCVAAYDDNRVVGTFFAAPHTLRIGSTLYPMTFSSWCTVDQDYRLPGLTVGMIEAMRRGHLDTGRAFSLGIVSGAPDSVANRFWALYGKAFPQNYRVIAKVSYWLKVLNPAAFEKSGVTWWERRMGRVLGPVLKPTPWARKSWLRPYEATDLAACADLLARADARLDWAVSWSAAQLAAQLEGPVARTLVLEQEGHLQAMVNYHHMRLQGVVPLKAALIDLCAMPDLSVVTASRVFGSVCAQMRDEGVDAIVCLRSSMFPATALVANAFIPFPGGDQLVALFAQPNIPLAPPRTWSLLLR